MTGMAPGARKDTSESFVKVTGRCFGVAEREKGYTGQSFQALGFEWSDEGFRAAKALLERTVQNLWLSSSEPGTGKTGLAVLIAKKWADEKASDSRVLRCHEFPSMDWRARDEAAQKCQTAGLVVLDDLHRLSWDKDATVNWFHSLVDGLYRKRVSVVVTSNAGFDELRRHAAANSVDYLAAFDRFRDGGMLEVHAKGQSRRG